MRSEYIVPAGLIAFACVLAACALPSHAAESKSYSLSGFDEVDVSAGVDVVLKQGPFAVSVDAPRGYLDQLNIELEGSRLVISRKSHMLWIGSGPSYKVTVTAPDYKAIETSSGADVLADNLAFKDLRVSVSSGADVKISGTCAGLRVNASSGADFKGDDLKCQTAEAEGSSGADILAFATASARGHASSGADIRFSGNPAQVDKSSSSGGSVTTR